MTLNQKKTAMGIGAPVLRKEDERLLTGNGQYTADFTPPATCFAFILRSPYAHAVIKGIRSEVSLSEPGIISIFTGADLLSHKIKGIPHNAEWKGAPDAEIRLPDGFEVFTPEHMPLATDRVRYVGEPVALVIGETEEIAQTAAELLEVDYEVLPSVIDAREGMQTSAPVIWPGCSKNISLMCEVGNPSDTEVAFEKATHIVKFESWVQRITGSPMEPRAAIGLYDRKEERYMLRSASGRGAVQTRERLAYMLGVPIENCHVVFGDMGGNFGTRNAFFPEAFLMPWAAKIIGRPVKWISSRSDCFSSDYQGRDLAVEAELALDASGKFLGLRGTNVSNLGAYVAYFWPLRKGLSLMQSIYDIPAVSFKGLAVFTNTPPTAVYRSAGRPEAIYVIERLIDLAADQCGFDRVELRRKNIIPATKLPFTTAVGVTYDSGDYNSAMELAIKRSNWEGYKERKATSLKNGMCRGRAVANYIEVTSGIPRERVELRAKSTGKIELAVGTMSSGQGHETSYAQVAGEWLDLPIESIDFIANDTDKISVGGGSHSGRSMRLVSIAIGEAIDDFLSKGKKIAAQILETDQDKVDYKAGHFIFKGSEKFVTISQLANACETLNSLPPELQHELIGVGDITNRAGGYPYGSHVCEVEVDPETGMVRIVRWTGVDDVGLAVNPLILHGQAHGAIVQGVGQALLEQIYYSKEGFLLSGSFMDYAMPRALDFPFLDTVITETPATSHPYGIRPGGEGGTTPALGVVVNAIVDALSEFGVKHIEMPTTPEKVWRAIKLSRAKVR